MIRDPVERGRSTRGVAALASSFEQAWEVTAPADARQYSRIGRAWVGDWLGPCSYATRTALRTKALPMHRRTRDPRAMPLPPGHTELESTDRPGHRGRRLPWRSRTDRGSTPAGPLRPEAPRRAAGSLHDRNTRENRLDERFLRPAGDPIRNGATMATIDRQPRCGCGYSLIVGTFCEQWLC